MKIDYIVIFTIIFLILIGFGLFYWQKTSYNKIPKKIWTYIESKESVLQISKLNTLCIESWKKYNPDYEIIVLTNNTVKGYVTIPIDIVKSPHFNDNQLHFSELIRLWTLSEHGGIWIEPTVLLKESVDNWLFHKYAEFSGFYSEDLTTDKQFPIIENWFLACNKGSEFIKQWRDEFSRMIQYPNVEKYIESLKGNLNFGNITDPIRNAQYITAQKVLQIDKYQLESTILKSSEKGPKLHYVESKGIYEKGLELACSNKKYQTPLIYFSENESKILSERLEFDLTPELCGWLD